MSQTMTLTQICFTHHCIRARSHSSASAPEADQSVTKVKAHPVSAWRWVGLQCCSGCIQLCGLALHQLWAYPSSILVIIANSQKNWRSLKMWCRHECHLQDEFIFHCLFLFWHQRHHQVKVCQTQTWFMAVMLTLAFPVELCFGEKYGYQGSKFLFLKLLHKNRNCCCTSN